MRMYPLFDPGERALRSEAMVVRRKVAEPGIAASCQGKAPGESTRGKCQGKVPGEKCPLFAWPPVGKLTISWPLTQT
jgi:hypothetical protein